jgi:hypothetical protein
MGHGPCDPGQEHGQDGGRGQGSLARLDGPGQVDLLHGERRGVDDGALARLDGPGHVDLLHGERRGVDDGAHARRRERAAGSRCRTILPNLFRQMGRWTKEAHVASDISGHRSRRAVLSAALGAGVGLAASALGRPSAVRAADDEPVLLGQQHEATKTTLIQTQGNTAILGSSTTGIGVAGFGGPDFPTIGVYGTSSSLNGRGIYGVASGSGNGVAGISFEGTPPAISPPPATGVYGYGAQDATASGVKGESTSGRGVHGMANGGEGVRGEATTGTGGLFVATDPAGTALRAIGRVRLDQCVGVATVKSGSRSVTVKPGIDLVAGSAVVATLQGSAGGTTTVQRVAVSTTANTFAIYLTANATRSVKVAWHVLG